MITAWIIAETTGIVNIVLGFFARGGLFMWPLLACSIVSVTVMILRGLALRRNKVMPSLIENEIERLTPGESPERLSRIVHHDGSSLARIARVALQYLRSPRSENVEAVQDAQLPPMPDDLATTLPGDGFPIDIPFTVFLN